MRTLLSLWLAAGTAVLAQPVPESPQERGWAVLEAALKAAGGREKLAAVKDMTFELQTHVVTPAGPLDLKSKSLFVLPDTVRQEIATPAGAAIIALDRWSGWRIGPGGRDEIPAAELQRTQAELARTNILFRAPADRSAVRWAGTDTVGERACDLIEIANVAGAPIRLCVDRQSGDVVKRSYRGPGPDGKPAAVEELLSDFRTVDGLRLYFRVRVLRDGKLARESVTSNMKINVGLKAEELLKPPPK